MISKDFWSGQRVLVGGGCGFLGSYMVPMLVEAGAKVTVVDKLESGLGALKVVSGDVNFFQSDLREPAVCRMATRRQDAVINLAAHAYGLAYSRAHHGQMLVHNLLATLGLLEAASANGVARYMVVSSSCVYPDDAPTPTPEIEVIGGIARHTTSGGLYGTYAGGPEAVNAGYGWAKRVLELAGGYYAQEGAMAITVVRPFNPYGAHYRWPGTERAHVVPTLVKRILDGEDPLVVWGSGQQRRNFLHASDTVQAMLLVMERQTCEPGPGPVESVFHGAGSRVQDVAGPMNPAQVHRAGPMNPAQVHRAGPQPVNIGTEDTVSIAELVALICRLAGRSPQVVFDTSQPEGKPCKSADATRLRQIIPDWQPQIPLEAGIAEMIAWYYDNF